MRPGHTLVAMMALGLALAACVEPASVSCADGRICPATKVCAPEGGCVTQEQLDVCAQAASESVCLLGATAGVCRAGFCVLTSCGDGLLDPGEVCDDGNTESGDGCRGDCGKIEICDDQIVDAPRERCDDGNTNPADGCDACMLTEWQERTLVGTSTPCAGSELGHPVAVATDALGNRHVADPDHHRVYRVEAGTGAITVVAGTGAAGYSGDGGAATGAALAHPSGLALDGADGLYIADRDNQRIRRVELSTGIISTVAGTGVFGYGGQDGEPAANARFRGPTGLYFDALAQRLYIADTGNHVVRALDLSGGATTATISTIAGTPQVLGKFGDGMSATLAYLYQPAGVTRSSNGDLFIADSGNQRVRRVAAATGFISTVLGDGIAASSGQGTPSSSFPVDGPLGLACDALGNLFVTSSTTVRLLPASSTGVVDGTGEVQNIGSFRCDTAVCAGMSPGPGLSGLEVVGDKGLLIVHACTGRLIELTRQVLP